MPDVSSGTPPSAPLQVSYRVEIRQRNPETAAWLMAAAAHMGITGLTDCRVRRLFFLQGYLTRGAMDQLSRTLLADPVTEYFAVGVIGAELDTSTREFFVEDDFSHSVDVTFLPGVTDPAAASLIHTAHLLGITELQQAATGQRFLLWGDLSAEDLQRLSAEVFANPVVQRYTLDTPITPPFVTPDPVNAVVEIIPIRDLDDAALLALSKARRLSLDADEMRAIRAYYAALGRDPTDAELEMLAQTWSEHCVHKTFKALVDYTGPDGQTQQIDGILKTYIRAATEQVNKAWVRSAFVDNAGIIAFDERYDLAFKVETHNRPSAIEPFGGANTGVGGVIRDVLGVSARPIANTDVLCFGLPDMPYTALPAGVLHPRRVAAGVVRGIEDYGNKMGIPTINGAIHYHPGYTANPLVFCGCLGILPHGAHRTEPQPGDLIVVIGGRTGRDGLRGATFSSMEMDTATSTLSSSAVQIGNPITEKQVQEVVLRARDERLYNAITDCGAGGLSSAVGEMGSKLGARVQLADVPLKYPGLRPWEIWLSEAQERMVLAVRPANWARFEQICAGQDVEAVVIGTFETSGHLIVDYADRRVVDLSMDFLHDGIPQMRLKATWQPPAAAAAPASQTSAPSPADTLLRMLAHPTVRSKEQVIRRYDHEVQGGTALKPLVGVDNHGPGDAAVLVPQDTLRAPTGVTAAPADLTQPTRAVALSVGLCPQYSEHDPYAMAWAAVDEAFRNLVAVGADPDQVAILDNFCWGNTRLPDRMGALVRAAQGCHDAALAYNTPFISGKDSLNNEYLGADGERHAIPGTLVISAVGMVPDVHKAVTMDLKQPGNLLFVLGATRDELGGSLYNTLHDIPGGTVPQPNPTALETLRALHRAIQAGLVLSCHDVSEGGLACALAEMCIAGRLGAVVEFDQLRQSVSTPDANAVLGFSETTGRFIVEIRESDGDRFSALMAGVPCQAFGVVLASPELNIRDVHAAPFITLPVADLEHAWRGEQPTPPPAEIVPSTDLKRDTVALHTVRTHTRPPLVLILHANGTNRDHDAWLACQLAGGEPEIVHINQLISGERNLLNYHMLVLPGGFSYGDDLGAGLLWAQDLRHRLKGIDQFIASGRPVLGICNGFQTLVKSGLLPGADWWADEGSSRSVTLTYNRLAQFECRWVYLQPNPHSSCLFTEGLNEPIYCPVAHGEGRVAVRDETTRYELWSQGLAPLIYVTEDGERAAYPANPNGSVHNIAGLCNPAGNIFGLMPHPENHIYPWQHPRWHRGEQGTDGLRLFRNGILRS